jgi:hypothetical protein
MPLRFAYTNPDGSLAIVNAAPKKDLERVLGPLTQEEYGAHVIVRSNLGGSVTLTRLPDDWSPPDRDRAYRNAWRLRDAGKIVVDMSAAREIHREKLRNLRAPRLVALDQDYLRADERGDLLEKQRIAQRKQALRDAPADPAIDAAQTPDELRAVIPAALR